MAYENFETNKSADRLQEGNPRALATDIGQADLNQLRQSNQQNTDVLVGKGALPPVELWTKQSDTRAAAPRVAEAEKKETYGKQTEASKRTIEAVDKVIESSKLSGPDKNGVRYIARAVAEGDTEKLQNLVDAAHRDPNGRQTLTKVVDQVNKIYHQAGITNLHLKYVGQELEVSGDIKQGQQRHVNFKPDARPVSGRDSGSHDFHNRTEFKQVDTPAYRKDYGTHDSSDNREANIAQEKGAAKALRDLTEQAQRGLAEKEQRADQERQAEFARHRQDIENMNREQQERIRSYQGR